MIGTERAMRGRLRVGRILAATATLIRARPWIWVLALIPLAGAGMFIDTTVTDSSQYGLANFAVSVGSLIAQFIVLDRLLRAEGLIMPDDEPRGAAYVMAAIATGIGITLGLVLLVIPGLLLSARWAVVLPDVVARRVGAGDAMAASAEMTREDILPLALASAVLLIPSIAAIAVSFFLYPEDGNTGAAYLIGTNLAVYAGQILGWYASVAIYALYRHSEPTLEEVFA